jgi:hypothetical protein
MSIASAEAALLGAQQPRICSYPRARPGAGDEAVELAAAAGLDLDPWQQLVLRGSMGERPDGRWAAMTVGLCVPRQNGKGGVLEARELAGLFLLDERLITHSAHRFDTSLEHFKRVEELIAGTPDFAREVARNGVQRSHGEEGITLRSGQRIRFRTRTKGGGRGFSGDLLVLDEAMDLPESALGALMSAQSARPNPQLWYAGSAVDQAIHDNGLVFARVRLRGLAGDETVAYFEWSLPFDSPDAVPDAAASDPQRWADANPALNIRITPEFIAEEFRSLALRTFAVERLCVGDWPDPTGEEHKIDPARWAELIDLESSARNPVCFALEVSPDRSHATICAAGWRPDRLAHVEVVDRKRGTGWLAGRAAELRRKHRPVAFVGDASGPLSGSLADLEDEGIEVLPLSSAERAQACGMIYDAVDQGTLRHRGDPDLATAIAGATTKPQGDGSWLWWRKTSTVDISPLVGCTMALWGLRTQKPRSRAGVIDVAAVLAG